MADPSIESGNNFVVGANKPDTHMTGANYPRDFQVDIFTDIALAQPGQQCARCGGTLQATRGVEVGHIFKLGTFFSETLGANYLDAEGRNRPITMGCYGIGVGRLLAAAIEQNHDDNGIVFPTPPSRPTRPTWSASTCPTKPWPRPPKTSTPSSTPPTSRPSTTTAPTQPPGVKFNDADLMGLPVRLVISPRNLNNSVVEVKGRTDEEATTVPLSDVVDAVRGRLAAGD